MAIIQGTCEVVNVPILGVLTVDYWVFPGSNAGQRYYFGNSCGISMYKNDGTSPLVICESVHFTRALSERESTILATNMLAAWGATPAGEDSWS